MRPRSPTARLLFSFALVLHLVLVADHVFENLTGGPLLPISDPWVEGVQLRQSWNMFRKPWRWDTWLVAEGITADRQSRILVESNRPPDGPFLRASYDRMKKLQNHLVTQGAKNDRYRELFADWLCRQHPDVVTVRLSKHKFKHLTPDEALQQPPPAPEQRFELLYETECPR
ncbi:MAG: hypothetical protein H6739_12640 [Alphaproteobacteria bacterium]|nr:hypothetical protein [Alphaproteobacteria bacterium]